MQFDFFESTKASLEAWHASALTFHKNVHQNVELGYILSGSTTLSINGAEHHLKENDIFFITPYQVHSFDDSQESQLNAIIIIFDPLLTPTFIHLLRQYIPTTPVVKIDSNEALDIMKKILLLSEENRKYKDYMLGGHLSVLLGLILEKCKLTVQTETSELNVTQKILTYCNEHYMEPLSIEHIASALNMNRTHISNIFNNLLKISFRQYINQFRIQEALKLINSGKTNLTEIAYESGFQSVRSFNRNFIEYVGVSPTDYKAQKTQPS